jgi:hypothetical protein
VSLLENIARIRTFIVISALVGIASLNSSAQTTRLSRKVPATKPPVAHYHVVHGWPVLPENNILDEVSAVAVDSLENVFVLQRGGRKWPDSDVLDETPIPVPTIFVFDGHTGRLLTEWGENILALPHSITVDGKDNVWVADVALNQVFKFFSRR